MRFSFRPFFSAIFIAGLLGLCGGAFAQAETKATQATPNATQGSAVAKPVAGKSDARKQVGLKTAVIETLRNNPLLVSAASSRVAAGYLKEAAEWQRYPKFSANLLPNLISSNSVGTGSSIAIEQPLWAGGRIDGQISNASFQETASRLAESELRRKLIEQSAVAYFTLLRSQERFRIVEGGASIFEGLVGYVERRMEAGAASSSDAEYAHSRLAQIIVMKEQVRAELERAKADFQAVTVTEFDFAMSQEVPPYTKAIDDTLIQTYLSFSPLIAQRKAEVDAALATVEVRKASIFPTVALRVERVQSALPGGVVLEDNRIGLTFQYVPDAGLASLSLIKEAESKVDAARAEVQKVEVDVKMAVKTTIADFKTASGQIKALQEQVQTVAKSAKSFLRQFESGRKTWIDVLNIHRELIDVETALSRAKLLLEQSQIRFMANSGELLPWLGALPS